jgi:hypothetical protein
MASRKSFRVSLGGGTAPEAVEDALRGAGRRLREGGHAGGVQLDRVDIMDTETVVYLSGDAESVHAVAEEMQRGGKGGGKPQEVGADEVHRGR